jgi:hypothetical protein
MIKHELQVPKQYYQTKWHRHKAILFRIIQTDTPSNHTIPAKTFRDEHAQVSRPEQQRCRFPSTGKTRASCCFAADSDCRPQGSFHYSERTRTALLIIGDSCL